MSIENNHVYYNFAISNDTNSDIVCEQTDSRSYPILSNAADWQLFIQKFSLPADNIDAFLVSNETDYQIKIGGYYTALQQRRNFNVSGVASLPTNAQAKYKNYEDFIENYNRANITAFKNFYTNLNSTSMAFNNGIDCIKTISATYSVTGPLVTDPQTHSRTITVPATTGYRNTLACGLELTLSITNTSPYNLGLSQRVFLTSPDGVKVLVTSMPFTNPTGSPQSYVFKDDAMNSQYDNANMSVANPINTSYLPIESFAKFYNRASKVGNWTMTIESLALDSGKGYEGIDIGNPWSFDVSFTFKLFLVPDNTVGASSNMPQYPPILQLNETTKKLEYSIHESYFYACNYYKVSPKLNFVLQFDSNLDSVDSFYRIRFPQVLLSSSILSSSFINISQSVSSLYRLTSIREILIKSNSIPVSGEYNSVSNEQIVMSLDINADTDKNRYEFNNTNNNRLYDLIGAEPLYRINFSLFVTYNSGETVRVMLPPQSLFKMLAVFHRKPSSY